MSLKFNATRNCLEVFCDVCGLQIENISKDDIINYKDVCGKCRDKIEDTKKKKDPNTLEILLDNNNVEICGMMYTNGKIESTDLTPGNIVECIKKVVE